jgi:DNA-directed RNA polymerase subunit RPC12/RpoP
MIDNENEDKIKKLFEITCKKCLSKNVDISFYAGFIHDCGGDTGSLSIECNDCGSVITDLELD